MRFYFPPSLNSVSWIQPLAPGEPEAQCPKAGEAAHVLVLEAEWTGEDGQDSFISPLHTPRVKPMHRELAVDRVRRATLEKESENKRSRRKREKLLGSGGLENCGKGKERV